MSQQLYVPYFAINPYGIDVPGHAMETAGKALETQLGGAWQVLDAKTAFEEAGGLHAFWRGVCTPDILRWTTAIQAAALAAYQAEQPLQTSIEDMELLDEACIDVIAATRYAYTTDEWLNVFTAHFGMSDYCDSLLEALTAGRRWLAIAGAACPIAAAEQEIRVRSRPRGAPAPTQAGTGNARAPANAPLARPRATDKQGAWTCNWT